MYARKNLVIFVIYLSQAKQTFKRAKEKFQEHHDECKASFVMKNFHNDLRELKSNGKQSILSTLDQNFEIDDVISPQLKDKTKYQSRNIPEMYEEILAKNGKKGQILSNMSQRMFCLPAQMEFSMWNDSKRLCSR